MILSGRVCGRNRNFYHSIETGKITIETDKFKETVYVNKGLIEKTVNRDLETKETSVVEHGKYAFTLDSNNKKINEMTHRITNKDNYRPFKYSKKGDLYGSKGTLFQTGTNRVIQDGAILLNGSLRTERFVYDNGKLAYKITRYPKSNKPFIVYDSDGIKRLEISTGIDMYYERNAFYEKKFPWALDDGNDFRYQKNVLSSVDSAFKFTELDSTGTVINSGSFLKSQRVGEWIIAGKTVYYLQGVIVSKDIFDGKINPKEVLSVPNAQLRASLIAKIGLEQIVKECGGEIVHEENNMALYKFNISPEQRRFGGPGDSQMKILKVKCPSTGVYYCLRVPPAMTRCEQARQWTFGVENPTVNNANQEYLEIATEA